MLILLGLTFASIFNFSSQDGQTSSGLSRKVSRKIIDVFPYTKNLSEKTKNKIVERSQPIIRKGAHLSIYTLVGILIMSFISTYKLHLKYKFSISRTNICNIRRNTPKLHTRKNSITNRCWNRYIRSIFRNNNGLNNNISIQSTNRKGGKINNAKSV